VDGRRLVATTEDLRFRGRNVQRNTAFTDLLFSSALRRQEAGSLLIDEIPEVGQESFVGATAKRGTVRAWTAESAALTNLARYINVTRRAAVKRAQKAGRYDTIDPIWVDHIEVRARHGEVLVTTGGAEWPMKDLDVKTRMRLMRNRDSGAHAGPEPLWLWLGEDGLPMNPKGWGTILHRASERFKSECERLGRPKRDIILLSPHSLRFSYALYVLVVLHQAIDRKYGYSPTDPYDESRYLSAYQHVRDILGHSSTTTTRNIYLEPVKGLRGKAIVGAKDVKAAIAALALTNPEVRDIAPDEYLPDENE
jgi:integrase